MRSHRSAAAALVALSSHGCALGTQLRMAAGEFLCGCAGLDDYSRYLAHHRRQHSGDEPLSREAFFRRQQAVRWHGVQRCC